MSCFGILAALSSAVAVAAQASWDAPLHLIPAAVADKHTAKCLDGSLPGFYIRQASSSSSSTKWKLHIQGGGWCTSASDCAGRANSILGSSSTWSPWLSTFWPPEGAGFYGLMSLNDSQVNPFGEWNFAWLAYCDGSSQTSDKESPVMFNGTELWMRGRAILDAQLEELDNVAGFLTTSTEVIISGTSAGGLSTYLHTSYIKSRMAAPSNTRVVAMPDAGFFLDHAYYGTGAHVWYETMYGAIQPQLWNATLRGAGAACLAAEANATSCFFPEYLYKYLTDVDGVFVLQSVMDTANIGIGFGLRCDMDAPAGSASACTPAESAAILGYSTDLSSAVQAAVNTFPGRDGLFATTCYQHEESCRAADWYGITIGAQNANNTFFNWYTRGGGPGTNAWRVDVAWPGDASCAPQNFTHGAC